MLYNINPKKWGDAYWKMSHYITIAYPDMPTNDDKINVKSYFESLQYLLPCEKCRNHYIQNLQNYPLTDDILSSKSKLIKWLVNLHNLVNKQTGKKEYEVDEVIEMYTKDETIFNIDKYQNEIFLLILLVLMIGLILYMKFK